MNILKIDEVRNAIADMLFDLMDIDRQLALQDTPFSELHKDFDSLTFAELQFMLEDRFKMEFSNDDKNAIVPVNVTELAEILIAQYVVYHDSLREAQEAKDSQRTSQEASTATASISDGN